MYPQFNNLYGYGCNPVLPFVLKTVDDNRISSRIKRQQKEKPLPREDEELLYCVSCLKLITGGDQRISIEGNHEHTFFNPAGIIFKIGCFQEAPGTLSRGIPTVEFSWFSGFFWCITLCSGCLKHIGWQFTRNGQMCFLGLILNLLTAKK